MKTDLDQPKLHVIQYDLVDGSYEFFFGALCLVFAISLLVQLALPATRFPNIPGTLYSIIQTVIFLVIVESGIFILDRLVKKFRERITIPRSGYLAQRRPRGIAFAIRLIALVIVCGFLGASMAYLFSRGSRAIDWMPGASGLLFGAALCFVALRVSLARFYILAGLIFVSGVVLSLFGIGNIIGVALFWVLDGLILLSSGGITLRNYLHKTPLPENNSLEIE
jgi:hypothetical protein